MTFTFIVCIGLSAAFLTAGAVLLVLSRRNSSRQSLDEKRDRTVMDDHGDRVIWEMGQGWPLVNKEADARVLTRRVLFRKAVLGIFAAFVSWRLARGSAATQLLEKIGGTDAPGSPNLLKRAGSDKSAATTGAEKEMAFLQDQDHNDSHNDFEIHNDNLIPHQDATNPRTGVHFDVPHIDADAGHVDIHNDSQ